jgi:hypothetical protein
MTAATEIVGHRAELLARLHLTRRLNVDVHRFDEGGTAALDFICTVRSKEVAGFLPFGVFVWGTDKQLADERAAGVFVKSRMKHGLKGAYCFPVIALAFSMEHDVGHFCWIVEPCDDSGQLRNHTDLRCVEFTPKQLNRLLKRVVNWYRHLQERLIVPSDDVALTDCGDNA